MRTNLQQFVSIGAQAMESAHRDYEGRRLADLLVGTVVVRLGAIPKYSAVVLRFQLFDSKELWCTL
jgi:hypothetical protein